MSHIILKVERFKGREYVPLEDVLAYVNSLEATNGYQRKGWRWLICR